MNGFVLLLSLSACFLSLLPYHLYVGFVVLALSYATTLTQLSSDPHPMRFLMGMRSINESNQQLLTLFNYLILSGKE